MLATEHAHCVGGVSVMSVFTLCGQIIGADVCMCVCVCVCVTFPPQGGESQRWVATMRGTHLCSRMRMIP